MGRLIGLDVGYGFVKVSDGDSGYVFPSVVGEGHSKPIFRTGLQRPQVMDDLRIGLDGRIHFVGRLAIRQSRVAFRGLSPTRTEGNDLKILSLAALSLFCQGPSNDFEVVTGLPPGRMHLLDDLIREIQDSHRVRLYRNQQPQEVDINVSRIEVVPQPLGTYWSQVLNSWGQTEDGFQGRFGIIDIGFRTTDLAAIEDGEFIPESSRTISAGLASAYDNIGERLMAEHGLERESYALDEAVIRGRVNVAGKTIDLSESQRESFEQLATKILVEVTSTWRIPEFDRLILSGGGGRALQAYLMPHLPQGELAHDPVAANSKGYLAWGHRLWRGDSEAAAGREPHNG